MTTCGMTAFPSSLPDPPHSKKRPKLTWHDRWCILRPNDYKQQQEDAKEDEDSEGSNSDNKGRRSCEPSVLEEDHAVAARASTYTNATNNFVETYQEGLKDHWTSCRRRLMGKVAASNSSRVMSQRNHHHKHHEFMVISAGINGQVVAVVPQILMCSEV